MKIIKKSQIAVLSILLMAGVAGYINYKYNPEREKNLGQTMYVNGKDSFTYDKVNIYSDNNTEEKASNDAKTEESSIAVFKYDRDNMYSELSENYRNIIKNDKSSETEIKEYQQKLSELVKQKNLITMVENVIKTKGCDKVTRKINRSANSSNTANPSWSTRGKSRQNQHLPELVLYN